MYDLQLSLCSLCAVLSTQTATKSVSLCRTGVWNAQDQKPSQTAAVFQYLTELLLNICVMVHRLSGFSAHAPSHRVKHKDTDDMRDLKAYLY